MEVRMVAGEVQEGIRTVKYKVDKDVLRHLSVGLYKNFARAIKELVSNSYDAGATETRIRLNTDEKSITILDNGEGMTFSDVKDKLFNLASAKKKTKNDSRKLGREQVGAFGIGFVSIYPYCKRVHFVTKKKMSNESLEITIDAFKFFSRGKLKLTEIPIKVNVTRSSLPFEAGETIIKMEGLGEQHLKDLKQKWKGPSSIEKMGGYEKFKWTLSQYAPIQFPPDRVDLREFFERENGTPMRLWLNTEELFRNVPKGSQIIEKGNKVVKGINFRYVIMTPYKPIEPQEARGIQIRFRNVGLGLPQDFNVVRQTGANLGKITYICGEAHIYSDISENILVDRDNLSFTKEIDSFNRWWRERLVRQNWVLENLAAEEKPIYESLSKLPEKDELINNLKSIGAVHFESSRIRTGKASRGRRKSIKPRTPMENAVTVLRKKGFEVETKNKPTTKETPPIEIIPDQKKIVIYDNHDDLSEKLKVFEDTYVVSYEEWDPTEKLSPACRITNKTVVFNSRHPLLKFTDSLESIKRFLVAIEFLSQSRPPELKQNIADIVYKALKEAYAKE